MMDIEKDSNREAFEAWFSQEFRCDEWEYNPFSRMEFNGIDAYSCSTVNAVWSAWQAAKEHEANKLGQETLTHYRLQELIAIGVKAALDEREQK